MVLPFLLRDFPQQRVPVFRAAMRPATLLCILILVQVVAPVLESFTSISRPKAWKIWKSPAQRQRPRSRAETEGGAPLPKYVEISQDALLAAAVVQGRKDAVPMLLDSGAPLEAIASKGRTALACAAVVNDADSAQLLLEAGAQLEAIDDTGRTPLALAAAYGNLDVLRVYVEFGANLEAQDNGKLTPLLWAAVNGNEDVVRFLVVNGANIQAKDEDGMTALGLATVLKRQTVRDFLTEAGAGKKTA